MLGNSYDDMTSLYYLHEPGVSENLEIRYLEDKIMSYIGRVLVVCNPFKRIPLPNPQDYAGKKLDAIVYLYNSTRAQEMHNVRMVKVLNDPTPLKTIMNTLFSFKLFEEKK